MPAEADHKEAPTVRYLSGRPRETVVTLDEPVEVDGVEYHSFVVRKLTARELEEFQRRPDEERELLKFVNCDITPKVYGVLDADDGSRLAQACFDFLPPSWRAEKEPTPEIAGPTPSSSDAGPGRA